MTSNFERLQKIINQVYAENFSFLFHVEPRNLPRSPVLWPRWSGPFDSFVHSQNTAVSFEYVFMSKIYFLNHVFFPWKLENACYNNGPWDCGLCDWLTLLLVAGCILHPGNTVSDFPKVRNLFLGNLTNFMLG